MTTHSNTSGVAQVLMGAAFGGICAYAIATDISNNLKYFGPINPELAGITVVAAICIAILPWQRWGALKGICLALTCWAAASAYSNSLGLDIAKNAKVGNVHATANADGTAARATLARITETADTATLTTMVAAGKAKAEAADKKAREAIGDDDTACLKVKACREAGTDLQALLSRLSQAKARDAAQDAIAKADAKAEAAGTAKVDVLATKLASTLNTEYEGTAQTIAIVLAILTIGATQGAALLGHSSLVLIGEGVGILMARRAERPKIEKASSTGKKAKPVKLTRDAALAKMLAHIEMCGGEIFGSGASIAAMLGVPRSTVTDNKKGWLAHWIKSGQLIAEKRGNATVWCNAKKAA